MAHVGLMLTCPRFEEIRCMQALRRVLLSPLWLYLALLGSGSALAQVTASVTQTTTSPPAYPGSPCTLHSLTVPITASGNQLYFPASGSGILGSTCSGQFTVTLAGATATVTQVITSNPYPGAPCTLTGLTGALTASGNQLFFAARGSGLMGSSCSGNFIVTLSGATPSVTQTITNTSYPGAPCYLSGFSVPLTASGNQLFFPVRGTTINNTSCSGYYTVTLR
jgi:hypothetical protein